MRIYDGNDNPVKSSISATSLRGVDNYDFSYQNGIYVYLKNNTEYKLSINECAETCAYSPTAPRPNKVFAYAIAWSQDEITDLSNYSIQCHNRPDNPIELKLNEPISVVGYTSLTINTPL